MKLNARMLPAIVGVTSVLLMPIPGVASAYYCDYSREISKNIDATKAVNLKVMARAGLLEIKGEDGVDEISITAKLCAENKEALSKMGVDSKVKGKTIHIETVIPRSGGWNDNDSKSIDLLLTVPTKLHLEVDDSSGEARVEAVESLSMNDSSGALHIDDIGENVEVNDSSGALSIRNVRGDVEVSDSSGSIEIEDVAGEVFVKVDSSGEIRAKNIGKNVVIGKDSSGSITVKNVKGDFVVRQDGSGGITYKNIGGNVDIPERKRDKRYSK